MVDLTNHLISIVHPSTTNQAPQQHSTTEQVIGAAPSSAVVMAPEQEGAPQTTMVIPQAAAAPTLVLPTFSNRQKDTTHTKLFVGGLPYHTTDKTLKEHFQMYGEIDEAVVITDRTTGKSKGYGFVIMSTKEEADQALKEPNPIIEGRKANVNLAILGAKPRGNAAAAAAKLPLTISPEFTALLSGQYGALGLQTAPQTVSSTPYAVPTTLNAAATALQLANAASSTSGPGGKARSSMNLSTISGRQPVQQTAAVNPYMQQLYAAAAFQQQLTAPQLMPMMQGAPMGTTGNPLLDLYTGQLLASTATHPGYLASSPEIAAAQGGLLAYQAAAAPGMQATTVDQTQATSTALVPQQQQQQQDNRFQ